MATTASEVITRDQRDENVSKILGLIPLSALWLLAAAFVSDDWAVPVDNGLLAPGALLAGVASYGAMAWGLPRLNSSWAIEVQPEAVRWSGGLFRRERVIRRWQVLATRSRGRGPSELTFHDALGKEVGAVPLNHFPAEAVVSALKEHDWPLPRSGALAELAR